MDNITEPVKPANEARELDLVLSIGTADYLLDPRIVQSEAIYIAQILARGVRKLDYLDSPLKREIVALQLRPVAQAESEVAK